MNNKNAIKKITYYALVGLLITLSILFNVFIQRVQVSGHSMDPTLKTNEKLFAVKHIPIDRFDIVVAKEKTDNENIFIIKRVIGLPGDTVEYKKDQLYVNGKKMNEPYLNSFKEKLKDGSLIDYFTKINSNYANFDFNTDYLTVDSSGNDSFKVTLKSDEYFLLGDDRPISKDSRAVGPIKKSDIISKTFAK
jgi:signal peptidase I